MVLCQKAAAKERRLWDRVVSVSCSPLLLLFVEKTMKIILKVNILEVLHNFFQVPFWVSLEGAREEKEWWSLHQLPHPAGQQERRNYTRGGHAWGEHHAIISSSSWRWRLCILWMCKRRQGGNEKTRTEGLYRQAWVGFLVCVLWVRLPFEDRAVYSYWQMVC